jgi:hypothetical protein
VFRFAWECFDLTGLVKQAADELLVMGLISHPKMAGVKTARLIALSTQNLSFDNGRHRKQVPQSGEARLERRN